MLKKYTFGQKRFWRKKPFIQKILSVKNVLLQKSPLAKRNSFDKKLFLAGTQFFGKIAIETHAHSICKFLNILCRRFDTTLRLVGFFGYAKPTLGLNRTPKNLFSLKISFCNFFFRKNYYKKIERFLSCFQFF